MVYLLAHLLSGDRKALAVIDGEFRGSENLEEAKKLIPNYNGYHAAGHTWSTSATLYWMSYHPCIVQFESLKEVEEALLDKKIIGESAAWGRATYTLVKPETKLNIVFDPALIDAGVNTAKPFYEQ